jgi:hypothetical protein
MNEEIDKKVFNRQMLKMRVCRKKLQSGNFGFRIYTFMP